ncbi:MAG: hypothetical protein ACRDWA_18360 [Acidimicrobiia bacterium]
MLATSAHDLEPSTIETDRLHLIPLEPGDADEPAAALFDRSIYDFIGNPPGDVDELRSLSAPGDLQAASERSVLAQLDPQRQSTNTAVRTVQATVDGTDALVAWIIVVPW